MKSTLLLKTKNNNQYIYDLNHKYFNYCHPILHKFFELEEKHEDIEAWMAHLNQTVEIEAVGPVDKKDVVYYYHKYQFLRKNGYGKTMHTFNSFKGCYNRKNIEQITLPKIDDITFQVTDSCNLECTYCCYGELYENVEKIYNKSLSPKAAKKLIDYLIPYWESDYNVAYGSDINVSFYGGEPLLNFSFIEEIVAYCKGLKLRDTRITFQMTTNAVLLDQYIDFLVENDFTILISLDGDQKHNGYRKVKGGMPAYDQIVNNIAVIQKQYPRYFEKNVSFNVVLHNRSNKHEIINFFDKKYGKMPLFSSLTDVGVRKEKRDEFDAMSQYEEGDESVELDGTDAISFLRSHTNGVYINHQELFVNKNDPFRMPTGTCVPLGKKIFVSVTGQLLPCEAVGHEHCFGIVTEDTVEIDFDKLVERMNTYLASIRKKCTTCYKADCCDVCLFQLEINGDKVHCSVYADKNDFSDMVASYLDYYEKYPAGPADIINEVTPENKKRSK